MFGERGEIGKDLRARRKLAFRLRLLSLARKHEHRARARRRGGLYVAQAIAHHVRVLERDVEASRHLEEHPRLGFSALAAGVRGVRAEEEGVNAPARLERRALYDVVDVEQRAGRKEPPRNAGLVGGDDDAIAGLRKARNRFQAALERPPFLDRLDVVLAVMVDRAVAIEDDKLHVASLERSAMRFIVPCSLPRKPMRLARTRGSLSITITLSKKASTGVFSVASALSAAV